MGLKLTQFQKNKENPFLKEALEEINSNIVKKWRTAGGSTDNKAILKAVDNNGEIVGHTRFIKQIEVDEQQFTKLYLSNFQAFFNLKPSSIRVFGYIMTKLKPKKDEFIFILDECIEYTEYKSHTSIHRGLAQLLEERIIARGRTEFLYFINPMVAFNGDRVTFSKSYVRKKKSKEVDPSQTNLFTGLPEGESK